MATDNSLDLKATLDTAEVQQKLQQLGQKGTTQMSTLEHAVKQLESAIQKLASSFDKANSSAQQMATTATKVSTTTQTNIGQLASLMRLGYAGHIALTAGKSIAGDYSSPGRAGLGAAMTVLGAGVAGFTATLPSGGWGGIPAALIAGQAELDKALKARALSEQDLAKINKEIENILEKQKQQYANAVKIQASAAAQIKHEREVLGLDLLSDDELRNRRQAAYDTRKHYEGNLLAGVYSTEGAAKEAQVLIAQAKNITAAINNILKSRKAEAEAAEKSKQAAEEKALAEENAINEEAFSRLQSLLFETTMEQWDEQVKKMPMGDLLKTKDDLKTLKQQLRFKLRGELEAGDLSAAELTETELKETEAKLGSLDNVINGASGPGLLALEQLSQLNASGYSTLGNVSVGTAVQNLQMQEAKKTNDLLLSNNNTLLTMSTYVLEIKNKVSSSDSASFYT